MSIEIQKEVFVPLYWATRVADSEQPMVIAEEITEALMAMVRLCQEAIEDHYMLSISDQPYNDAEAKLMVREWFAKHIK